MPWRVAYVRLQGLLADEAGGRPAVVVEAARVLDCGPAAFHAGVRPGQRLRAARLACPEAEVRVHDPLRARERVEAFLRTLADATPRVEPDAPLAAFAAFDVGPRRGERELLAELEALAGRLVPACGYRLEVGLAPNRLLARVAAELLRDPRLPCPLETRRLPAPAGEALLLAVPPERAASLLAPLPVSLLWPLAPETRERLAGLGLARIGDVAALPDEALRAVLPADAALEAVRLARGEDARPVAPRYPPPLRRAARRFLEPVADAEAWRAVLAGLAAELAADLQRRGEAARELWLFLEGEDGCAARVRTFARPEAAASALRSAAWRLLEREPVPGGLEAVTLEARRLEVAPARQARLWDDPVAERRAAQRDVADLLERMALRVPARLLRPGRELDCPRRERLLACWDPLRAGP